MHVDTLATKTSPPTSSQPIRPTPPPPKRHPSARTPFPPTPLQTLPLRTTIPHFLSIHPPARYTLHPTHSKHHPSKHLRRHNHNPPAHTLPPHPYRTLVRRRRTTKPTQGPTNIFLPLIHLLRSRNFAVHGNTTGVIPSEVLLCRHIHPHLHHRCLRHHGRPCETPVSKQPTGTNAPHYRSTKHTLRQPAQPTSVSGNNENRTGEEQTDPTLRSISSPLRTDHCPNHTTSLLPLREPASTLPSTSMRT
ncbi:hypothetical protein K458DRAFT_167077 [Lentithecium fluviatile CBS 122367]|uniref:Uncharacterized protein n=1 Tax=Lentithecium fluviatile CBS 122367 TaxID=1168545 RepID=A0A6G1IGI1_9PLEO|nr:hypothetical protein K458DRAFT_167077 [Lentithecium fluviatile CBS 122367]